jgi:Flp pilus assembly secretin CpaC
MPKGRGALWGWLLILVAAEAPARSVFIADPAVADTQAASPDGIIASGRKPGQRTLIAMGSNDTPLHAVIGPARVT